MIMLPLTISLRIKNPEGRGFRLWLPLFLIWPLVLILVLAFTPLVLLISLILWPFGKGRAPLMFAPVILYVLCNLRGMRVDISGEEQVYVNIK
jgi:hypothetical protein